MCWKRSVTNDRLIFDRLSSTDNDNRIQHCWRSRHSIVKARCKSAWLEKCFPISSRDRPKLGFIVKCMHVMLCCAGNCASVTIWHAFTSPHSIPPSNLNIQSATPLAKFMGLLQLRFELDSSTIRARFCYNTLQHATRFFVRSHTTSIRALHENQW